MSILITSGLSSKDVGGHSTYSENLKNEFSKKNKRVFTASYGNTEKMLPIGLRHLYFFLKIFKKTLNTDSLLTLDSFSVGIPSLLAARLLRKRIIARIGGDFLWESFVNKTGNMVTLKEFYKNKPKLSTKHRLIYLSTKFFTKHIDHIVFNSNFQKNIWEEEYNIPKEKTSVIYNFIPNKTETEISNSKIFLWAGRDIPLKNVSLLVEAFDEIKLRNPDVELEIITNLPKKDLFEKIKKCRAAILPSLSEMSPNFIIETSSFNKPFICTKESGLSELYKEGGLFFDPYNKRELVDAMYSILDDNNYLDLINSLKNQKKTHLWPEIAEEYLKVLCH